MSEVIIKDSSIKLFGQIISLPLPTSDSVDSFATSSSEDSKDESRYDSRWSGHEHESVNPMKEKSSDAATSSDISGESNSAKKDEMSSTQTVKKPDRIIPCPRCQSMDTKFCYYNNHNVNQPRHLCKNCQRYWTSGGTMRSVPVGSGRRKTKNRANGFVFYPATATLYWGSASAVPSLNTSPASTSVLGKHSREGGVIHDPSEVAKSSIWSTLGIKKGKNGFKGFELNGGVDHSHRAMVLKANPAALSRSLNFHDD